MGLISNTVDRRELKKGDHIYVWRTFWKYAHHGIYIGDSIVIHYEAEDSYYNPCNQCYSCLEKLVGRSGKRAKNVCVSCLDCFLEGGTLKRFQYSVPKIQFVVHKVMTCSTVASHPPEVVKERAIKILRDGFGDFGSDINSSEEFAYFCKTGDLPRERENQIKERIGLCGAVAGFAASATRIPGASLASAAASYIGKKI